MTNTDELVMNRQQRRRIASQKRHDGIATLLISKKLRQGVALSEEDNALNKLARWANLKRPDLFCLEKIGYIKMNYKKGTVLTTEGRRMLEQIGELPPWPWEMDSSGTTQEEA